MDITNFYSIYLSDTTVPLPITSTMDSLPNGSPRVCSLKTCCVSIDSILPLLTCYVCNENSYHSVCQASAGCAFIQTSNEDKLVCRACVINMMEISQVHNDFSGLGNTNSATTSTPTSPIQHCSSQPILDNKQTPSGKQDQSTLVNSGILPCSLSSLESLLDKKFGAFATEFNKIHSSFNSLKADIDTLKLNLINLESDLHNRITSLEERLDIIETTERSDSPVDMDPIAKMNLLLEFQKEFNEIERRSNNILLSGITESSNLVDATSHDLNCVKDIITKTFTASNKSPIDMSCISTKRLGSSSVRGKPRRLQVTLKNRSDVISVFSCAKNLPNGIKVTSDQTLLQRNHLKHLYSLAENFNRDNNHDKLTVKFKRGIPSLIDSRGNIRDPKNLSPPISAPPR